MVLISGERLSLGKAQLDVVKDQREKADALAHRPVHRSAPTMAGTACGLKMPKAALSGLRLATSLSRRRATTSRD